MNNFRNAATKEKMLVISSFLMMTVLVLYDQLVTPFLLFSFFSTIPFWKGKKWHRSKGFLLFFVAFYVLMLISFAYSQNTALAGAKLMTTLSFVAIPITVFLTTGGYRFLTFGMKWGLIIGSGVSMLISIIRAIIIEGGLSGEAFKANVFGWNMHPSYLSLILIISTALLWQTKSEGLKWKIVKVGYSLLTLLSVFYLRSLGAFVCIAVIILIIPIWKALRTKNWKWTILLPVYAVFFVIGVKSSPKISNDIEQSLMRVSIWSQGPQKFIDDNVNQMESTTVRLVSWTLSGRMIWENPWGVGVGDGEQELVTRYQLAGYDAYAIRKLNPHNQFIQTGVAIGIAGIIVLFVMFFSYIVQAYRTGNLAMFIAVSTILISCLFESMLERQVGVILTCILAMYTAFLNLQRNSSTE